MAICCNWLGNSKPTLTTLLSVDRKDMEHYSARPACLKINFMFHYYFITLLNSKNRVSLDSYVIMPLISEQVCTVGRNQNGMERKVDKRKKNPANCRSSGGLIKAESEIKYEVLLNAFDEGFKAFHVGLMLLPLKLTVAMTEQLEESQRSSAVCSRIPQEWSFYSNVTCDHFIAGPLTW